jgi:hypothetical protein
LVDPGPLPHPKAVSNDVSKMVCPDYGADEFHTRLAESAIEGWHAWNAEWDEPPYHEEGILFLVQEKMAPGGFEHDSFFSLSERGYILRRVSSDTLSDTFPQWAGIRTVRMSLTRSSSRNRLISCRS